MDLTNAEKVSVITERILYKEALTTQYLQLVEANKDNSSYPLEKIEGYLANVNNLNLMKEALNNELDRLA